MSDAVIVSLLPNSSGSKWTDNEQLQFEATLGDTSRQNNALPTVTKQTVGIRMGIIQLVVEY